MRFDEYDAEVLGLLGELYLSENEGDDIALRFCEKAVELNPLYSEAYFRRAIASHNIEKGDVCKDLMKAMEIGHNSAEILYNNMCK